MHTTKRNIDPAVSRTRSGLANAIKSRNHAEAAALRAELDRAKRMAAIRAAVQAAPPLPAEDLQAIAALLQQGAAAEPARTDTTAA